MGDIVFRLQEGQLLMQVRSDGNSEKPLCHSGRVEGTDETISRQSGPRVSWSVVWQDQDKGLTSDCRA